MGGGMSSLSSARRQSAGKRKKNARQEPGAQSGVCNSRRIRTGWVRACHAPDGGFAC